MSARVPDEVVEALLTWARMLWEHGALRDGAPSEVEIRAVLAAHRLAQLPEEPDGWIDLASRHGIPSLNTVTFSLTREQTAPTDLPVYVVTGGAP